MVDRPEREGRTVPANTVVRRRAAPVDLAAVHAVYMHPSVIPFLGVDPMPIDAFDAVFRELIDSECFFVVEVDGDLAGFYKASRYTGRARHVACLGTLAVAPAYQGRGVAQAMVTQAIDALRTAGIRRIELYVEADNPRGLAFYSRLGFEIEGRLRRFYQRSHEAEPVDEFIMATLVG